LEQQKFWESFGATSHIKNKEEEKKWKEKESMPLGKVFNKARWEFHSCIEKIFIKCPFSVT
jgi:hypothetical protein